MSSGGSGSSSWIRACVRLYYVAYAHVGQACELPKTQRPKYQKPHIEQPVSFAQLPFTVACVLCKNDQFLSRVRRSSAVCFHASYIGSLIQHTSASCPFSVQMAAVCVVSAVRT